MLIKQTLVSMGHFTEGAAACSSNKSYSGRLHRGSKGPRVAPSVVPKRHMAPPRGEEQGSPEVTP